MLIQSICSVPEVLELMRVINIVILIIKIVVPIILILTGMITFMQSIKVGDEDLLSKAKKSFITKCIAAICVFMIPTLVNVLVTISDPNNEYRDCLSTSSSTIDDSYEKRAEELLSKAETSKKIEDYSNAVNAVNAVKDTEKKKGYQSRLDSLIKEIESKGNSSDNNSSTNGSENTSGDNNSNNTNNTNDSSTNVGTVAGTIFMGDSRTNGLKNNAGLPSSDKVVAKDGGGYNDFVSHISTVNGYLSDGKSYNIVLNYGVNDMGNLSKYCEKYKSFINSVNSKNKVYVVSVNPVRDSGSLYAKNANIETFNKQISSCISGLENTKYCDVYSKATLDKWSSSYISTDSIHYNKKGYEFIYSKIKDCIG